MKTYQTYYPPMTSVNRHSKYLNGADVIYEPQLSR